MRDSNACDTAYRQEQELLIRDCTVVDDSAAVFYATGAQLIYD